VCGNPHGQHRAQYITTSSVTSSMAFTVLKEVKASLTGAHNWALVLQWCNETGYYQVWSSLGYTETTVVAKGDAAEPQPIHLPGNASLRILCPVSGKWEPSCWNHNYSMIPLLLGSGVTKFLNILRYETPMTVPSKKYGPMTRNDSYSCPYYNMWWVVCVYESVST